MAIDKDKVVKVAKRAAIGVGDVISMGGASAFERALKKAKAARGKPDKRLGVGKGVRYKIVNNTYKVGK